MKQKDLSENTIKDVQSFFYSRLEHTSKANLWLSIRNVDYDFYRACGFVFVTDGGSVIHSKTDCGNGYNIPIPFDLACKIGYRKICSKCGPGSYIESLFDEQFKTTEATT